MMNLQSSHITHSGTLESEILDFKASIVDPLLQSSVAYLYSAHTTAIVRDKALIDAKKIVKIIDTLCSRKIAQKLFIENWLVTAIRERVKDPRTEWEDIKISVPTQFHSITAQDIVLPSSDIMDTFIKKFERVIAQKSLADSYHRLFAGDCADINFIESSARDILQKINNYQIVDEEKELMSVVDFYNYEKRIGKVSTGFECLDEIRVQFRPKSLTTIFAFTSQCKSLFTTNIFYNTLMRGQKCVYFAFEIDKNFFFRLLVCIHSRNPKFNNMDLAVKFTQNQFLDKCLTPKQLEFSLMVDEDLRKNYKFKIYSTSDFYKSYTEEDILNDNVVLKIKRSAIYQKLLNANKEMGGLDILYVDYLGHIVSQQNKKESIDEWYVWMESIISQNFLERGVSVVLVVQSNRIGEETVRNARKTDKQAFYELGMIAGSSQSECSSDYVIALLYGPEQVQSNQLLLKCIKNRLGGRKHSDIVSVNVDHRYGTIYETKKNSIINAVDINNLIKRIYNNK